MSSSIILDTLYVEVEIWHQKSSGRRSVQTLVLFSSSQPRHGYEISNDKDKNYSGGALPLLCRFTYDCFILVKVRSFWADVVEKAATAVLSHRLTSEGQKVLA